MLSTLWQPFGEGSFVFQQNQAPVSKAWAVQSGDADVDVDELDWLAQSPDFNSIEQLWDNIKIAPKLV